MNVWKRLAGGLGLGLLASVGFAEDNPAPVWAFVDLSLATSEDAPGTGSYAGLSLRRQASLYTFRFATLSESSGVGSVLEDLFDCLFDDCAEQDVLDTDEVALMIGTAVDPVGDTWGSLGLGYTRGRHTVDVGEDFERWGLAGEISYHGGALGRYAAWDARIGVNLNDGHSLLMFGGGIRFGRLD